LRARQPTQRTIVQHTSVIELQKEFFDFSAGHFTIFSPEHRENLHGHNYHVQLTIRCGIGKEGMNFDYRLYKIKLREILSQLDQTTLLATKSPHTRIEQKDQMVIVHFNDEEIPFLARDVTLLDISNTTVEELSFWILNQLLKDIAEIERHHINDIEVKVFSNLAQAGSSCWHNNKD